jgi:hypothetical protein
MLFTHNKSPKLFVKNLQQDLRFVMYLEELLGIYCRKLVFHSLIFIVRTKFNLEMV